MPESLNVAPPGQRAVSLIVLFGALALVLLTAPDALLVVFAGLLFGVFISGGGDWIADLTGISRGWGIALFILLIIAALAAAVLFALPAAADQFDKLVVELPAAFEDLRGRIENYAWGQLLLERASPGALMASGGEGAARAVGSTFGALGSFVIMLFIGLYVAIDPISYRRGLVHLLAPSARLRGEEVLAKAASTLRNWLVAQMMAMTVVGVLTWLGLWAIGVPLAPILGLIAALFAFIPNIGPVIAAVPALLLAIPEGRTTVLLVIGVYLAVQAFESYLITPLIQKERLSLPPALVISVQLLLGVLFGVLGLALATPLTALGILLTREVYVADYLAKERDGHAKNTNSPRSRS